MEPIMSTIAASKDNALFNQTNQDGLKGTKLNTSKEIIDVNQRQNEMSSDNIGNDSKESYSRRRSEYTYHEEINRVSIKIIDEVTQEVIREIPPEKSLEILKQLMEIPGLFLDERR